MNRTNILALAEVLDTYYSEDEFRDLASIFDVDLGRHELKWLLVARQLVERLDHGNHRVMLEAVLEQLDQRNLNAIARTDWERRAAHENIRPKIADLRGELGEPAVPRELAVLEDKPFEAKSQVRDFLESAETEVFVVDPYVGVGTLDCFRSLKVPIRLLTGTKPNSIEPRFEATVQAFRTEGFQIEIRQQPKLHDRHIVFNERCWLVGSSLKDAGKKAFHAMEILDAKAEVVKALEAKWQAGTPYA